MRQRVPDSEAPCDSSPQDYQPDESSENSAADGYDDAVRVEVRPGEVVIRIRTAALQPGALAVTAADAIAASVTRGLRATRGLPSAPVTRVDFTQVPAAKMGDGYPSASIRADLGDEYMSAFQTIRAWEES